MRSAMKWGWMLIAIGLCGCGEEQVWYGQLQHDRVMLTATSSELVTAIPVKKGDRVHAGDLLVQLDPTMQQLRLEQAKAELQRLQAAYALLQEGSREEQLAAAKARWQSAKAYAVEMQRQLTRTTELRKQRLVAQAALDQAQAAATMASAQTTEAQQQYLELSRGNRPTQLDQGQAAVASAAAVVAQEQRRLADLSVKATQAGRVDDLPYQVGDRVMTGAVLALVQTESNAYGRFYIPETAISQLHVGQTVQVRADGIDAPWSGRIRHIQGQPAFTPYYALNQADRAMLMFLVEVELPATANERPNGMPLQWSWL